jgi:hypothetical protein
MIRINLLETAEKKRRRKKTIPSGTPIIMLYVVLLLMEGVLLFYWSTLKDDAKITQTKITLEAQEQLEGFNKLKEERDELASKMAEEEQQAKIFEDLNSATVGPANMFLYLSYMLTTPPPTNHAELLVQEQIGWNDRSKDKKPEPPWDPDRAWLTSFKESSEKAVLIEGTAISHHDTDEFFKRLKSTVYFQNVHFHSAKVTKQRGTGNAQLVKFVIRTHLNYDLEVGKEEAAAEEGEEKGKKKEKPGKSPKKKG